jgi:hypothetical protein
LQQLDGKKSKHRRIRVKPDENEELAHQKMNAISSLNNRTRNEQEQQGAAVKPGHFLKRIPSREVTVYTLWSSGQSRRAIPPHVKRWLAHSGLELEATALFD